MHDFYEVDGMEFLVPHKKEWPAKRLTFVNIINEGQEQARV